MQHYQCESQSLINQVYLVYRSIISIDLYPITVVIVMIFLLWTLSFLLFRVHSQEARSSLTILEPLPCSVFQLPSSRTPLTTMNINLTVTVDTTSVNVEPHHAIRVNVWHSPKDEVWNYDIPPTPQSNRQTFYLCPFSFSFSNHFEDCLVRNTTMVTTDSQNKYSLQQLLQLRASLPLAKSGAGFYVLTVQLFDGLLQHHDMHERSPPPLYFMINPIVEIETKRPFSASVGYHTSRSHKLRKWSEYHALMEQRRINVSAAGFVPWREHLYAFNASRHLNPQLYSALFELPLSSPSSSPSSPSSSSRNHQLLDSLVKPVTLSHSVYSVPLFSAEYVTHMRQELRYIQQGYPHLSRQSSPNSMNRYGLTLGDFGFRPFFVALQSQVLSPLAQRLFPQYVGNNSSSSSSAVPLDHLHAFSIQYRAPRPFSSYSPPIISEEDLGDVELDVHMDESEVTFNICLGIGVEEEEQAENDDDNHGDGSDGENDGMLNITEDKLEPEEKAMRWLPLGATWRSFHHRLSPHHHYREQGGEVYFKGQRDSAFEGRFENIYDPGLPVQGSPQSGSQPQQQGHKLLVPPVTMNTRSSSSDSLSVAHTVGSALIHVGQHWHGAHPIAHGARTNMVVWSRSSAAHDSPTERVLGRCASSSGGGEGPEDSVQILV